MNLFDSVYSFIWLKKAGHDILVPRLGNDRTQKLSKNDRNIVNCHETDYAAGYK